LVGRKGFDFLLSVLEGRVEGVPVTLGVTLGVDGTLELKVGVETVLEVEVVL